MLLLATNYTVFEHCFAQRVFKLLDYGGRLRWSVIFRVQSFVNWLFLIFPYASYVYFQLDGRDAVATFSSFEFTSFHDDNYVRSTRFANRNKYIFLNRTFIIVVNTKRKTEFYEK